MVISMTSTVIITKAIINTAVESMIVHNYRMNCIKFDMLLIKSHFISISNASFVAVIVFLLLCIVDL